MKSYISHYLTEHLSYEYKNFDVTLSYFIRETLGSIFLQPGIFATNPQTESTISNTCIAKESRDDDHSQIDPDFDYEKVSDEWY